MNQHNSVLSRKLIRLVSTVYNETNFLLLSQILKNFSTGECFSLTKLLNAEGKIKKKLARL